MSFYKEVPGRKTTLESTLKFDTTPTASSTNPVTSDGVANAVAGVLDDHATGHVTEEMTKPTAEAANYKVDNYFEQDGGIWKCTSKTDNGDGTWTIEAEKMNGIIPVLNELVDASVIVKDMTLRFMFSDASYNPQTAGVGTSGTWKKRIETTFNVWDWTNNNADWSYAFQDAFKDAGNDVSIIDAGNTSALTNMLRMFSGCTSLKSICLFDTSNVTSMVSTFNGASKIENLPLFNTGNVSAMNSAFANCTSLLKIPQFNTSKVTGFGSFAQQCTSLKEVPLLDTSRAFNVGRMFYGCVNVESGALDLYTQMSGQTIPPNSYSECFLNCGRDTVTGAAELAQIPSSWGGTGT